MGNETSRPAHTCHNSKLFGDFNIILFTQQLISAIPCADMSEAVHSNYHSLPETKWIEKISRSHKWIQQTKNRYLTFNIQKWNSTVQSRTRSWSLAIDPLTRHHCNISPSRLLKRAIEKQQKDTHSQRSDESEQKIKSDVQQSIYGNGAFNSESYTENHSPSTFAYLHTDLAGSIGIKIFPLQIKTSRRGYNKW